MRSLEEVLAVLDILRALPLSEDLGSNPQSVAFVAGWILLWRDARDGGGRWQRQSPVQAQYQEDSGDQGLQEKRKLPARLVPER